MLNAPAVLAPDFRNNSPSRSSKLDPTLTIIMIILCQNQQLIDRIWHNTKLKGEKIIIYFNYNRPGRAILLRRDRFGLYTRIFEFVCLS